MVWWCSKKRSYCVVFLAINFEPRICRTYKMLARVFEVMFFELDVWYKCILTEQKDVFLLAFVFELVFIGSRLWSKVWILDQASAFLSLWNLLRLWFFWFTLLQTRHIFHLNVCQSEGKHKLKRGCCCPRLFVQVVYVWYVASTHNRLQSAWYCEVTHCNCFFFMHVDFQVNSLVQHMRLGMGMVGRHLASTNARRMKKLWWASVRVNRMMRHQYFLYTTKTVTIKMFFIS